MLIVNSISKSFSDFKAVDNVSFTVNQGQIFGFLGRNGAGKTTTLRMLTGILRPNSGSIHIDGIDLSKDPQRAKAVTGFIPDRPYLYPKLTAAEFLEFCAGLYNIPVDNVRADIESLLRYYALWERREFLIESYSHGMKQRLATCAALIHKPKLLIVDEPMVGLDVHGARLLKASLKKYASEGMAIVLSTHTLHVAEELCDMIAIIDEGKLKVIGSLDDIKQAAGRDGSLEELFLELTSESAVLE